MYRIFTTAGVVTCTADHSLLLKSQNASSSPSRSSNSSSSSSSSSRGNQPLIQIKPSDLKEMEHELLCADTNFLIKNLAEQIIYQKKHGLASTDKKKELFISILSLKINLWPISILLT